MEALTLSTRVPAAGCATLLRESAVRRDFVAWQPFRRTTMPVLELRSNVQAGPQGREYDAIVDRIAADGTGRRILDWGAGHGQITARLLALGMDVASYDYAPDEPPGRKPLDVADAEVDHSPDPVALPYDTGAFDAVLSCGVLEHVSDPDASLEEIRRVLAPRGRLYVYKLPNRFSYLEWLARVMGLYYHGKLPDDRIYTEASTRDILERHGFAVRELRTMNMLPLLVGQRRRMTDLVWRLNVALSRVPGLSRLATNVEAVADRLDRPSDAHAD
jgi:SAM-dependent methyltransferase